MSEIKNTSTIAKYSIVLMIFENGIGSILHSFKIPFAGHMLSINQIGILTRVAQESKDADVPLLISFNTCLLKSLGPAGKKLTPMLAILSQGILFSLPLYLLGINLLSLIIGIFLASVWAFMQPLILTYLFFGDRILEVVNKILIEGKKIFPLLESSLVIIIISLVILKLILAFIYSYTLLKLSSDEFEKLSLKLTNKFEIKTTEHSKSKLHSAAKELFKPLFVISLIFTGIFTYYLESNWVNLIWTLLRPITIGFILFYFIKLVPLDNLVTKLKKLGFNKFSESLEKTLNYFK